MQPQQCSDEIDQGKAESNEAFVGKEIKMNRRELLQDQYEDALFALLMDEIATKEGKRAIEENERLKNDPSAAIPEDVDRRCLQTIRRHFAKHRAYATGRFTVKAMKRVVMAAGIAALLFTGAFAASETVRVNTLNLAIEVFETNTTFRFENTSGNVPTQFSVGWLPEGYELVDQGHDNFGGMWYDYQKSENECIHIDYTVTDGTEIGVDTEDAEIEYVEVDGMKAMLIRKNGKLHLVWPSKDNTMFLAVDGTQIAQDDLIHVANSLNY